MPHDAYTLRYLCLELDKELKEGKVNKIMCSSRDEIVMAIYSNRGVRRLLINVDPGCPRIGLSSGDYGTSFESTNFCMLLRKHLSGATVTGIRLVGFDRIVAVDFLSSPEFCDSMQKTLFIELMGRYSNAILTEDGIVLGGFRGINSFDNGIRPLFVGKPYAYPPTGDKKEPLEESLAEVFEKVDGDAAAIVCSCVSGLALSTVEQVLYEFAVEKNVTIESARRDFAGKGREFFEFLKGFCYSSEIKPCVVVCDGEVKDVSVKPYAEIKGERLFFDDLVSAEEYFFSERARKKEFNEKGNRLKSLVDGALKKCNKKLAAVRFREKEALSCETNRIKGELIIANIYKIKSGDESVVLDNYYDGSTIEIALDARLSPSQNAQAYYKKYNKQKRSLGALAEQKERIENDIKYFESFSEELMLAESASYFDLLLEEAESVGLVRKNKMNGKKRAHSAYKTCVVDGVIVKIGRTNAENDAITFSAKPYYVWFHVKDYHSSHVIVETGKNENLSLQSIKTIAEICAYYSKARNGGKVEVVYALKKFVKKPPNSKLGFCTYSEYRTVTVEANGHSELFAKG